MKRLLLTLFIFILLPVSFVHAGLFDSQVIKYFSDYFSAKEIPAYVAKNKTCSGVTNLDSFNKYLVYLTGYLDKNEYNLSLDLLNDGEKAKFTQLIKLDEKFKAVQNVKDTLSAMNLSDTTKQAVQNQYTTAKSCTGLSGIELEYCNLLVKQTTLTSSISNSDVDTYNTLLKTKSSFSPKQKMYDGIVSTIRGRIISGCSLVLKYPNTNKPVWTSEIKSLTDSDVTSFIQSVRDKYKMMSNAQKEKFRTFLKGLK